MKVRELVSKLEQQAPDAEVQVIVRIRTADGQEMPARDMGLAVVYDDSMLTVSDRKPGEMVNIQAEGALLVAVNVRVEKDE